LLKYLVHVLEPVIRWIGEIHLPFTHKLVTGDDYRRAVRLSKPGYGVIAKNRGELSNLFISGFWKHGAIITADDTIIDLTRDGCAANDAISFLLKKDFFILIRCKLLSEYQHYLASRFAKACVGQCAYDFDFDLNDSLQSIKDRAFKRPHLYCFESLFYWWSFVAGKPIFEPKEKFGVYYITGEDFINRPDIFEIVYLSRSMALR
jgi:hypothetical protein